MQSAEEFLREFLCSQTELAREHSAIDLPHIRRYFAPNYQPWDREKHIAGIESERIVSGVERDGGVEIVTTRDLFGLVEDTRYCLKFTSGAWHIAGMERACCVCHGSGKEGARVCGICKGKGWDFIGKLNGT
jgi:hypothetical protein